MNYTSLVASKTTAGSIKRWVNHATLDSEAILEEAQALIYEALRTREMRASTSLSMSSGNSTKALPTDFLDPVALVDITNNVDLDLEPPSHLQQRRSYTAAVLSSATPTHYAIFDEALQFNSRYSGAATLSLTYFKQPALLASSSNETNFLTTRYPHILRTACLAAAYSFRDNDERAQAELTKLAALIGAANKESDLATRGSVIVIGPVRIMLGDDRENYAGVNPAQILKEAQLLLFQTLRIREMRASTSLSMILGDSTEALPSDFLDPIALTDITNGQKLRLRLEADLDARRTYTSGVLDSGTPVNFAVFDELFQFECKYDAAATLKLLYFKQPTLLTTASETNFLTTRYLHLLRAACEVQLALYRRDAAAHTTAAGQLAALIALTNQESDRGYRGVELDMNP